MQGNAMFQISFNMIYFNEIWWKLVDRGADLQILLSIRSLIGHINFRIDNL